jgi:hypothetical protein
MRFKADFVLPKRFRSDESAAENHLGIYIDSEVSYHKQHVRSRAVEGHACYLLSEAPVFFGPPNHHIASTKLLLLGLDGSQHDLSGIAA